MTPVVVLTMKIFSTLCAIELLILVPVINVH